MGRHMTTEEEFDVGKLPLGVGVTEDAEVLYGEGFLLDGGLEALGSSPRHILDGDTSALSDQDVVGKTVDDNRSL